MATKDLRDVLDSIQAFVNYGRAEESDLKGLWNDLSFAITDNDEEIKKLKFMIDNGLGWEDMKNDITYPSNE